MKSVQTLMYLVALLGLSSNLYGWENKLTHPAITNEAVTNSNAQIDSYLKNALGLSNGLNTQLQYDFPDDIKIRIARANADGGKKTRSALEWLKAGSAIEDTEPNTDHLRKWAPWRARHHFYDPLRNAGLDNHFDHPDWEVVSWIPLGESALEWAITGNAAQEPTTNNNRWQDARVAFYDALTKSSKPVRDANLAMTFLNLGCIVHLLEDMGVPAHARNDFLYGHYRTWTDNGNPLEKWAEQEVIANYGNSLWSGSGAVVFDKLADYWDAGVEPTQPSTVSPSANWGLSECTNYQFLSDSTIFEPNVNGTKYYFPNPDINNVTEETAYRYGWSYKYRYLSGYGVSHLAKKTYIEKYSGEMDYYAPYPPLIEVDYTVDDDNSIYTDYAKTTIPRTIDYVTGLANYFFRGKITAEQTGWNDANVVEITIKNLSKNSNVEQVLKGGQWSLYWDDQNGVRSAVGGTVTVYDPNSGNWNSSSVLNYNQTTKMNFTAVTPPSGKIVEEYVLIYRGPINDHNDPNTTDSDDNQALAITTFDCIEPGTSCDAVCHPTPRYVTLTLSGFGSCCVGYIAFDCSGLNGTYILEQDAEFPCRWAAYEAASVSYTMYEHFNCTGSVIDSGSFPIGVGVYFSPITSLLSVHVGPNEWNVVAFHAEIYEPTSCVNASNLPNNTYCHYDGIYYLGVGGVASVCNGNTICP